MKPAAIVLNQWNKLDGSFDKVVKHFKEEEVHRYRLRVKQLRAFFCLLKYAAPEPLQLKLPAAINKLYDHTGHLRNLQLQKQRILHYCFQAGEICPATYLELLGAEEQHWKNKAGQLEPVQKKGRKLLSFIPGKVQEKHFTEFVDGETKKMWGLLLSVPISDEGLHRFRKIMKVILYNWSYAGAYAASVLPADLNDEKKVERFAATLGRFQDLCIALQLLDASFLKPVASEEETRTLNRIKKQLEAEKSGLKEKLNQVIETIKGEIGEPAVPHSFSGRNS
jgi:CHAD domain-containing protein